MRYMHVLFGLSAMLLFTAVTKAEEKITLLVHTQQPLTYLENGTITGVVGDKVALAFQTAGLEFEVRLVALKRELLMLKKNLLPNTCGASWFKNPEREKYLRYSVPLYQDPPVSLLVRREDYSRFQSYPDFKDVLLDRERSVGLVSGFSYGQQVDAMLEELQPAKVMAPDNASMFRMLLAGRFDYLITDEIEATGQLQEIGAIQDQVHFVTFSDLPEGSWRYIVCNMRTDPTIMERLDQAISKM
ncbi:Bacterial extracellular solute-binding proteins, family 3 [Roseibium album]|nr:Bacterial extracellular solute-binding proteins, family 3 [Roseibium album]